jgi:hypothetical protein
MSDLKHQHKVGNRYLSGILALAGVVFIWVSSSFAMNVRFLLLSLIVRLLTPFFFFLEFIWINGVQQAFFRYLYQYIHILILSYPFAIQTT